MATLTVLEFENADGAERMVSTLNDLQQQRLIAVLDAALVTWPEGEKKPRTRQLSDMTVPGALSGAFWGLLFGLIFFMPLLGMAVGAGIGALTGSLRNVGISDDLVKRVREDIVEGTSAVFLLTDGSVPDRVAEEMRKRDLSFRLVASNLSREEEDRLREVFSA